MLTIKNRFQIVPAVYLILKNNNQILMMRRFNTGYKDGFYSLPAGHLDGNETLKDALIRETKEETGLLIEASDLKLVHVMHESSDITEPADNERIDFYFEVSKYKGEPSIIEPHKCDDMRWFNINELPDNIVDKVSVALGHIKSGEIHSTYGW